MQGYCGQPGTKSGVIVLDVALTAILSGLSTDFLNR